jgi:hypothetical protein
MALRTIFVVLLERWIRMAPGWFAEGWRSILCCRLRSWTMENLQSMCPWGRCSHPCQSRRIRSKDYLRGSRRAGSTRSWVWCRRRRGDDTWLVVAEEEEAYEPPSSAASLQRLDCCLLSLWWCTYMFYRQMETLYMQLSNSTRMDSWTLIVKRTLNSMPTRPTTISILGRVATSLQQPLVVVPAFEFNL